jgi:putative ABC transport system permease protein
MALRNPLLTGFGRLAMTVIIVGVCTLLMLFLWSVYQGVNEGAVDYIRKTRADAWALQRSATNIIRGSSIMSMRDFREIEGEGEVAEAAPVLLLLASIPLDGRNYTLFLAGYRSGGPMGGPPSIAEGREALDDGEIVLDRVFARKHRLALGRTIKIQDAELKIVGLSTGTNAMVIQYAFVTLRRAQAFIGLPGLLSFAPLRFKEGVDPESASASLEARFPNLNVIPDAAFVRNNVLEMQNGFLAFLFIIAVMGASVLSVILVLLFSLSILERRREFVIMKALGAPPFHVPSLVVGQAALLGGAGAALGTALLFPVKLLVGAMSPELETGFYPWHALVVSSAVVLISVASSAVSARRLSRFYALEAFRGREG